MGKRSNSSEGSGSLDLLLDTMCNTFGGVMFIAISLIVISAMIPKSVESTPTNVTQESFQEMQKQIESLEKIVQELKKQKTESMVDPQTLEKLIEAQQKIETLSSQKESLIKEVQEIELKICSIKNQCDKENNSLAFLNQSLDKQKEILLTLKGDIDILKKDLKSAPPSTKLIYKKLEQVQDRSYPYYFILKDNVCYRIGFENHQHPHSDVIINNSGIVLPQKNKGTTLKNGIPDALLNEIKNLPKNRFPLFSVYPESSKSFFDLTTALKTMNIPSPWIPMEKDAQTVIKNVEKAEYEK